MCPLIVPSVLEKTALGTPFSLIATVCQLLLLRLFSTLHPLLENQRFSRKTQGS